MLVAEVVAVVYVARRTETQEGARSYARTSRRFEARTVGAARTLGTRHRGLTRAKDTRTSTRVRAFGADGGTRQFVIKGADSSGANGGVGIFANAGSVVTRNAVNRNGSHGISTAAGVSVRGNNAYQNLGRGLSLGVGSGYGENVITGNTMGTVFGGINAGGNVCNGSLTCP